MTVAFEQTTYTVSEGDGSTQVCVEVSGVPAGGLESEIVVTLSPSDDTAGRVHWVKHTVSIILILSCLPSQFEAQISLWQTHSR